MATTTPNFGWAVPTSTDLVKDGAVAIETLGDAIDASLVDLKGGTTGQVLKKATNTDMDFVWSADSAGMTNPMTTTGDTIYSSSGSTPARLGIGSTGQVLTVAGGVPSWATPAGGGGKLLQVVSTAYSTQTVIASNTYADSGLSLAITPSASTSKILVLIGQPMFGSRDNNSQGAIAQLLRGATQIWAADGADDLGAINITATGATSVELTGFISVAYLDSPATTSSVTYKTQGAARYTTNSGSIRFQPQGSTATMVLMEIGA